MKLIDRDAMLKAFDEFCGEFKGIRKVLEDVPAVDAAPVVHGEWVNVVGGFFEMGRCSICGGQWPTAGGLNFCPNCGADMRKRN